MTDSAADQKNITAMKALVFYGPNKLALARYLDGVSYADIVG
ncbi:MAG TPA: hypothetical protein VMV88_10035 [Gallionella sp.]|nr:hypothetical protein [Gallionella sp.]